MAITRVPDAQIYDLLQRRSGRLQVTLESLQEQIATGRKLLEPQQNPLDSAQVVRHESDLAALSQYRESSRFGSDILGAQDEALQDAKNIIVRAEEIATQQASDLNATERQAAIEEVHALLEALTTDGNAELGGRRLFGGMVLNGAPPFADPNGAGYTAATAYSGTVQEFYAKIGSSSSERVRLSTRGDQVFGSALVALEALETALRTNGNVAGTLAGLATGRDALIAERASVGARQAQLQERTSQVSGTTIRVQSSLAHIRDADAIAVVSQLTQTQQALQAVLAAGARVAQTSLVDLLRI
jgi:flagellar hook-associated protein 3 FlgL